MIKGSEKQTLIRKKIYLVIEYTSKSVVESFDTLQQAHKFLDTHPCKGWYTIVEIHTIN